VDKKGKVAKFIGLFVLVLIAEYIFLYLLPRGFEMLQRELTAKVLVAVLSILGTQAVATGDTIQLGTNTLKIVYECTGGFAFFIFSSAVLAYPASLKKKALGQIIGLAGIFLLNLIRLVAISFVMLNNPSLFDFIHKYLWQVTFTVIVIFMFILWVEKWGAE